jgi:hypothetical protein
MNKQKIFDKITCTHSLQNRVDTSQVYIAIQPAAMPHQKVTEHVLALCYRAHSQLAS